jgi:hypothetical protein
MLAASLLLRRRAQGKNQYFPAPLVHAMLTAVFVGATSGCICADYVATLPVEGEIRDAETAAPLADIVVEVTLVAEGEESADSWTLRTNGAGRFDGDVIYAMYGGCAPFVVADLFRPRPPPLPVFDEVLVRVHSAELSDEVTIEFSSELLVERDGEIRLELGTILVSGGE